MRMLTPKTGWNVNDKDLIATSGNIYTGLRVIRLWKAIDDAIRFWEMHAANPLCLLGYNHKMVLENEAQMNNPKGQQKKWKWYKWTKFTKKH